MLGVYIIHQVVFISVKKYYICIMIFGIDKSSNILAS